MRGGQCRGAGAALVIWSNEAMASQWKQTLISLVYLHVQSGSQFLGVPVSAAFDDRLKD